MEHSAASAPPDDVPIEVVQRFQFGRRPNNRLELVKLAAHQRHRGINVTCVGCVGGSAEAWEYFSNSTSSDAIVKALGALKTQPDAATDALDQNTQEEPPVQGKIISLVEEVARWATSTTAG